ncbi:Rab GDP dissociation inhibitor alpha [Coemansia sp. RSA 989]|nr:GDP dissociation inhibitor [Coemansia mojavensis]KAJ1739248.1 Rab GDP dissociation inhibitor alpha [Coemansia sp. RSA 1086]KAJ1747696.1 Rab GDP dissociation inhibitor alpha [Coemansia sp. RSA 1821]KAJ1862426.1 Rab GDP dissociation inhibitor alpha [Coemansia sp. RSA 989]KAJ1870221.1 Rab GDP dissociation inhibitor alpha [Coemansia sp. RSA 990]KAJ2629262.1 Rab GDP dissociation inhibitor alpha [Coemansia sp. RSA 1290]KAJ2646335.1 Rab GDP dissociation inhibitor alpha [Coemansia sp. RSA 1250]KA
MDEEYDVIILGTGLTECMLSGILAVEGKKVLHIDRNDFYGGECASVNLTQLYQRFRNGAEPPKELGRDRDYLIDLIPKFLMTGEGLIKVLVYTNVVRYLEFSAIATSMVYNGGKIYKVPSTSGEATMSPLVGMLQKFKARSFFEFLQKWQQGEITATQKSDLDNKPMSELYDQYSLNEDTQEFIGHAMALYLDEKYKKQPARATCERVIMYASSAARALEDNRSSPYIYPQYGLGDLPQAFARLSAVYAGTFMLDTPVDEIVRDDKGVFVGVRSGEQTARAKQVIGDPSYFRNDVRKTDRVIRAICILRSPIPKADADSAQIILPQRQIGREHDIYVTCLSSQQKICPQGFYVASISTIAETSGDPKEEIAAGLKLLGPIEQIFVSVSDVYEPVNDGTADNVFISRSYDATSHFETVYEDVKDMYRRITGKELVLQKRPEAAGDATA